MTKCGEAYALAPGSTIGILGAGQLGRMLAIAAAQLGFRCHIYSDVSGPAFDVAAGHTVAGYDDEATLAAFAGHADVVTYEFENIPAATVDYLSRFAPVRPGAKVLACAQDRVNEKTLAREIGAATAEFAAIDSFADLERALDGLVPCPAVLKMRRDGYDGKGQAKILRREDARSAYATIGGKPAILESFVTFAREISVIAARSVDGTFRAFDVTENEHRDHILHRSMAPARIGGHTAETARGIAQRMADRLDYIGVFGLEFFVVGEGANETLVVNELAPRVHNSGHWTIEGAVVSQFEQHIRAVAGWPLGATTMRAAGAEMINLIGGEIDTWAAVAAEPGAAYHHYGKNAPRPGRKMGHVTRLLPVRPA